MILAMILNDFCNSGNYNFYVVFAELQKSLFMVVSGANDSHDSNFFTLTWQWLMEFFCRTIPEKEKYKMKKNIWSAFSLIGFMLLFSVCAVKIIVKCIKEKNFSLWLGFFG